MIRAVIVDDEKPALDLLKLMLEKSGQIDIVGAYVSANTALEEIKHIIPDAVFLDIEMSEMSGLELAEKITDIGIDTQVIFVTAYNKYAIEAFRVNAIDYILKPFSSDDIAHAINRLKKLTPPQVESSSKPLTDYGRIYCFGSLTVYGAGREDVVKWRTSKTEELFAFMLNNLNVEVPKWKIIDALWPEYDMDNISVRLHTTVYQLKKTLLNENIKFNFTFQNGKYKMELPDVYIDSAEFETITDSEIAFTGESIEKCNRALDLYKGNYLENNEYLWSVDKAEELSQHYLDLVFGLVDYYMKKSDYYHAEKILQKASGILPLDDDLNILMLKLYYTKKDKTALIKHYNKIQTLYQAELDIEPSTLMKKYYKNALML